MMKKSLMYFGFAIPKATEETVASVDEMPHIASYKFGWSVVSSLNTYFDNVHLISTCDIRNFPAAKKLFFSCFRFESNGFHGHFVGFINLIILKHISRLLVLMVSLPFILQKKKPDFILVHGTHTPFMLAAILTKIIFRIQIGILLTDQHGKEVKSDGLLGRLSRRLDTLLMSLLLHRFDNYFCLSSTFITKYKLTNALVIPGILSDKFKSSVLTNKIDKPTDARFSVVFAGGVTSDNGVDRLIEAAEISSIPKLKVTIYGNGELVQVVKDAASRDQRIAYGGILHGDDLTRALLSADVAINPRPTNNEYSQNSFPSKLIEYLATGVPTLTTPLVSIPEEINDCFYYANGDDAESLSLALLKVYETSTEERLQIGTRAQERVAKLYGEEAFGKHVFSTIN